MKHSACVSVVVVVLSYIALPVWANQNVGSDAKTAAPSSTAPPAAVVSQNQVPPAQPVAQQGSNELAQVEAALGGNMSREYNRYVAMTQNNPNRQFGFARYLRDKYESKRMSGVVLAGIVAPIIAGLTTLGVVQLYRQGLDNGGFCNHVEYDEISDEYDTDCRGDGGELAGIILISAIGGIATIGVFVPGVVKLAKYGKRLRRIKHLAHRTQVERSIVKFDFGVSPRDVFVRLQF